MKNQEKKPFVKREITTEKPFGIEGVDYNVATTHKNIRGLEYRYGLAPNTSFTIPKTSEERKLLRDLQRGRVISLRK